MTHVPRRLLKVASGLLLLLCVATLAQWVRSYSNLDVLETPLGDDCLLDAPAVAAQ